MPATTNVGTPHWLSLVQVATEGDAFTVAFHDPIDAISWALESQHRLLALPWAAELLTQQDAREQHTPPSVEGNDVMFKGLRVRMAMHTGQYDSMQVMQRLLESAIETMFSLNAVSISLYS